MSKSEQALEAQIQAKGLNAPRLTPALIDAAIASVQYHVFPGSQLTVCCLTLRNGYTVTGESACASPENFDAQIGKTVAYENARNQIWKLEGYLLKERLHAGTPAWVGPVRAAAEFLENDQARDLMGLHRIRVHGQMMTRGDVAKSLADLVATADSQSPGSTGPVLNTEDPDHG